MYFSRSVSIHCNPLPCFPEDWPGLWQWLEGVDPSVGLWISRGTNRSVSCWQTDCGCEEARFFYRVFSGSLGYKYEVLLPSPWSSFPVHGNSRAMPIISGSWGFRRGCPLLGCNASNTDHELQLGQTDGARWQGPFQMIRFGGLTSR